MAQPDVVTASVPIDFDFSRQRDSYYFAEDSDFLLTPSSPGLEPFVLPNSFDNGSVVQFSEPEISFPGLPPLLRGHPDVHLRKGIINAFASDNANCERAFFAADLSQVYAQHARWVRNLPDIEPFFGGKRVFQVPGLD